MRLDGWSSLQEKMDPQLRMFQSRPGTVVSVRRTIATGYRLQSIPSGTKEEWLGCSVHLEGPSLPVTFHSSLLPLRGTGGKWQPGSF